jgi:hypothetical protein
MRKLVLVALLCWSAALMRADFTYMETTQMTGGSMAAMMQSLGPLAGKAREPIVTTHIVKGSRRASISRNSVTITDLDKETITTIDNDKKTYSVMTFAEMKQRMEQGMQRAQGRQGGENVQANFKISAKATGQTKNIQGLTAKEMVLTMTTEFADASSGQAGAMDMVNDSWVAPLPGYEEVRDFNRKMAAKMGAMFGSGMQQMAMMGGGRGNMGQSLEEMAKEMQKMDGIPVETLIKMMPAGGAANAAAPPSSASNTQASGNAGTCSADSSSRQPQQSQTAAGALAGALGGRFGGFGRRKKEDEPAPAAQPQAGCAPAAASGGNAAGGTAPGGSLMEMTTLLTSFSPAAADSSKFEVPAGYKQVEQRGR